MPLLCHSYIIPILKMGRKYYPFSLTSQVILLPPWIHILVFPLPSAIFLGPSGSSVKSIHLKSVVMKKDFHQVPSQRTLYLLGEFQRSMNNSRLCCPHGETTWHVHGLSQPGRPFYSLILGKFFHWCRRGMFSHRKIQKST